MTYYIGTIGWCVELGEWTHETKGDDAQITMPFEPTYVLVPNWQTEFIPHNYLYDNARAPRRS